MPRVGISITKQISFRGATQEFSNVYYYEMGTLPDASGAATMINNLVTLEKTFHSTAVTFTKGRCWKETGDKTTSEMINQVNLSGTGSGSTVTSMDRERAFLFRLRAGIDTRGNPVYLRKWYHSCGNFVGSVAVSTTLLEQTSTMSQANRDTLANAMQNIGDANGSAGVPKLCAKSGRLPTAGATWSAHSSLEHHQLGDQWRSV